MNSEYSSDGFLEGRILDIERKFDEKVRNYIKNNLKINLKKVYTGYPDSSTYKIELYLRDSQEVISETEVFTTRF